MRIGDCLELNKNGLSNNEGSAARFYNPQELQKAAEGFLYPAYHEDGPLPALQALVETPEGETCLFWTGAHGAGKTSFLLMAAALLSGHDPQLRQLLLDKLPPDDQTAQTAALVTSRRRLVLVPTGLETIGIQAAIERALVQSMALYGLSLSDPALAHDAMLAQALEQFRALEPDGELLILIDDVDQFLTSRGLKSQKEAQSLYTLLEALNAAKGGIRLVCFSETPLKSLTAKAPVFLRAPLAALSAGRQLTYSGCLEGLIHNLMRQTDPEAFNQMVGRFIRQKDHYFYTHYCQIRRWGKQISTAGLWSQYDTFITHITNACYPLHPFTVYLMTLLAPLLRKKSMLQYAAQIIEDSLDKEFIRVWPPFVYPSVLVNDEICQELLAAEEAGWLEKGIVSGYLSMRTAMGDQLNAYEDAVLKGVLLTQLCRLSYVDKTDLTEIISKCTGIYKSEEIDSAFRNLEEEYGAVAYDTVKNVITIHAEPCGRKDYERQRSRALLRCGRLNCVRDCDEYLLGRLQLNTPVDTSFAQQMGINSSEWQWDKEFTHISAVGDQELTLWKKTIATRHNVAEHRGLLVFLYCPEDQQDAVQELAMQCAQLKLWDSAVEIIVLMDTENRFRNGVRDWNILKRFTPQEQERYRRYYEDGVRTAENQIIGAFHQMTREQQFLKPEGLRTVSLRLETYCSNRFSEIFNQALPFHFDGFERKLTNQVRNNYVTVVTKLLDDTVTNARGYMSLSDTLRTRLNNLFLLGVPHSWQVLTKNCDLVEPLQPQVLEIFLLAENELQNGALTVGRLFRSKLYAPYGMNEYSLGLLICLFIAYNRNRIEITSNGVSLRPENVVSLFILKTKIRFSELFAMKLSLKIMSEEKEILHACDETAANRYVENCSNLYDWLRNLSQQQTLSEAVAARVSWSLERLEHGTQLYDQLYHSIDQYLKDMNSDKPPVRCLAAARIQEAYSDLSGEIEAGTGYYYSPQFARVVSEMKAKGDTVLNRFFHGELAKLDCTVAWWENFRKQYLELAEALVKCGRMEDTYALLQKLSDIEKKVGSVKPQE